ncbi:NAD(P)-binding protein [Lophiostoma macrostomum CBS 122681]|uniref:NAD(P)-binding protein n=1 Tax=Lophiostoma macrostomum CBS 122681 TaxID=1314788 RepID=A0A6A6T4B6_9PLEO|nr:NAD(P)-binding protein [Lophiostoma macrostomum CBS 122681]
MSQQTVLLIGGSGAQGFPIVEALSRDSRYAVRVLTRNAHSDAAKELLALANVTLAVGEATNEADLRKAFLGVDLAFVNLNSNVLGIPGEIFWGMRIYDIALESGVKHYVWSALEDVLRLSGYDEACRVGHYEGKSRITEWMKSKAQTPMKWSVLTTGPYIEMLHELLRPTKEDGTAVFRYPLEDGAIPFVHLDDIGNAAKWLFDHPEEATGLNLKTAVEHASGDIIAKAFMAVTGQPARYEVISKDEWFADRLPVPSDFKMGQESSWNSPEDPALLTYRYSFGNWWNLYQRSAGNAGLIKADYQLLDRILPDRVKSVKDWMEKVSYDGEPRAVLKNYSGK